MMWLLNVNPPGTDYSFWSWYDSYREWCDSYMRDNFSNQYVRYCADHSYPKIYDKEDTVTFNFDMLGVRPEDITIELRPGNYVAVTAKRHNAETQTSHTCTCIARHPSIADIPIKEEDVTAKLQYGVLTITVKKSNPKPQVVKIPVQVGSDT